jgi:carboxypeptidase PM20D1
MTQIAERRKKTIKRKILRWTLVSFFLLIVILIINTLMFSSKQVVLPETERIAPMQMPNDAIEHLSKAIQYRTVSYDNPDAFDSTQFLGFQAYLQAAYPLVHKHLKLEKVNRYSLLYEWKGKDASLLPVIMLAHMDVVPVEEASADEWNFAPYSGAVASGYIWGRGAMDDKLSLISIMEATEQLLRDGYTPERTIYFAFGHDEEVGGREGAKQIAKLLRQRGIKAEFLIDEGGSITNKVIPITKKQVAVIGTAEKGYMSVEMSVNVPGGHSSIPAQETAITILSEAIIRLRSRQFPSNITPPLRGFGNYAGPELPFLYRIAYANLWLFEGLILKVYERSPSGNSMVRTTVAPTVFQSGVKDNIIPVEATAVINFRILPGQSTQEVLEFVEKTLNDHRIKLNIMGNISEPSPFASTQSAAFMTLQRTISQLFPEVIISPYLVVGGTDTKHYVDLAKDIYRFLPLRTESEDLRRIHGIDEKIAVENFRETIQFYHQLIKNINNMDNYK